VPAFVVTLVETNGFGNTIDLYRYRGVVDPIEEFLDLFTEPERSIVPLPSDDNDEPLEPMREPPAVLGTGDVQITLRWNSLTDLDLHVIDPDGVEIYYYNPYSPSGGQLDVDANADCDSYEMMTRPVENIFWPEGEAPEGTYRVFVEYYADCANVGSTDFTVRVLVDGMAEEYSGTVYSADDQYEVVEFTRSVPSE
jgi:hypothetical protein